MKTSENSRPHLLQMIRAPFLSSIIAPIIIGTMFCFYLTGVFYWPGFLLVMVFGILLHTATNVFNDIYDTKQGTDGPNIHRNEFSGGSGILLRYPERMPDMYRIARISLLLAFFAALLMMFFIDRALWAQVWILFILSAFFSKYYTAAPVKLAYRGIGEVSVWFAFGPMAILIAAVGQNTGFRDELYWAMPPTGLSTLSILLIGQLIDLSADTQAGKLGVAGRRGTYFTAWVYLGVQSLLILNVIVLSLVILDREWILLSALLPYVWLFPKTWSIVYHHHDQPEKLKPAAALNVQIHLGFSVLLSLSLGIAAIVKHMVSLP